MSPYASASSSNSGAYSSGYPGYQAPDLPQGESPYGAAGGEHIGKAFGTEPGQMDPWAEGKWNDENWSKNIGDDYYEKMAFPFWDRASRDHQFRREFGEGQRRFDAQYGLDRQDLGYNQWANQRDFGEDTRRWGKQFDFQRGQWEGTQDLLWDERRTDQFRADTERNLAGVEEAYKKGLISNQQFNNETMRLQANLEHFASMDANNASRDVAGTYAGAQRYGADQQLAGTLGAAGLYSQGGIKEAELGLQGTLGAAGMYSNAQRYGSDQERLSSDYAAQMGFQGQMGAAGLYSQGGIREAELGAGAQRYGAELGLQGQLGSAGLYSNAQRYQAQQELAGRRYGAELGLQGTLGSAQTYAGAQLGVGQMEAATAAQRLAMERTQGLTRQEQMQMQGEQLRSQEQQARWGAFGRSQTPNARWARNWG
jgi:hypothetical protein